MSVSPHHVQVTVQPRRACHLAAAIADTIWNALLLLLRSILTILIWIAKLWIGVMLVTLTLGILACLGVCLFGIGQWAFRACFRRPLLPPSVEMAAAVEVGEEVAKDHTPLLGGGTHVRRPSGMPAKQQ